MATILMDLPSAWDVLDGVPLPDGYRVEITNGKIIMTPQGEDRSDQTCTVHRTPTRTGTYLDQETIAFGEDLVLPLEGREIVVRTDGFPRSGG
ncbi:hypothetical protein [Streptomyces sp. NPDC003327]